MRVHASQRVSEANYGQDHHAAKTARTMGWSFEF